MIYSRAKELMEADLGPDLVALDQDAGLCFGFNEVATSVWRRLKQPATFKELRDGLLEEFEVSPEQCARELQSLLDELIAQGLVAKGPPRANGQ